MSSPSFKSDNLPDESGRSRTGSTKHPMSSVDESIARMEARLEQIRLQYEHGFQHIEEDDTLPFVKLNNSPTSIRKDPARRSPMRIPEHIVRPRPSRVVDDGSRATIQYLNRLITRFGQTGCDEVVVVSKGGTCSIDACRRHSRIETLTPPAEINRHLVHRLKHMAGLTTCECREPQRGRARCVVNGRKLDLDVVADPVDGGERLTMRVAEETSVLQVVHCSCTPAKRAQEADAARQAASVEKELAPYREIWAKPPSAAEYASLPRWAQLACAARCLRRVQPLYRLFRGHATDYELRSLELAIATVESTVRGKRLLNDGASATRLHLTIAAEEAETLRLSLASADEQLEMAKWHLITRYDAETAMLQRDLQTIDEEIRGAAAQAWDSNRSADWKYTIASGAVNMAKAVEWAIKACRELDPSESVNRCVVVATTAARVFEETREAKRINFAGLMSTLGIETAEYMIDALWIDVEHAHKRVRSLHE